MSLQASVEIILGKIQTNRQSSKRISFELSPVDLQNNNSGITSTTRLYRDGKIVNLIAPNKFNGKSFLLWEIIKEKGANELFLDRDIFITINDNTLAKCFFKRSDLYASTEFVVGVSSDKIVLETTLNTGIEFVMGTSSDKIVSETTLNTGIEFEII